MKKTTLLLMLVSVFMIKTQAQVTIGSGNAPKKFSMLEVVSTPSNPGGLRLPHLDDDDKNAIETYLLADEANSKGLLIYSTSNNQIEVWDGTQWLAVAIPSEPWLVSGGSTEATSNTENIYHMGAISIGSAATADASAALNVNASDKGVLLPRVALTGSTDVTTIPNPTTGLLVYNTGTGGTFSTTGYLFWDGAQWKLFASASSEVGDADLNCTGASMTPAQQVIGGTPIIAGTVLQIPYTGSNGGSFNGATLVSIGNPEVTAIASGGILATGNGVINFALSGTPTIDQQAPNGIVFNLQPFLDVNPGIMGCTEVVVGNVLSASINEVAVMGRLMLMTDNTGNDTGTQYYALSCNSPDGKFSIRAGVPITRTSIRAGNQYLNVQIRNNQSSAVPVIWNFNTDYGSSLSTAGVLTIPPQRWGGDQNSGDSWTDATGSNSRNGAYWGQVGIYDGNNNGPEYRRYTWIPQGEDNSVAYEAHIMVALDTTTPTTAVHPTMVKCYIKFTEVTAAR